MGTKSNPFVVLNTESQTRMECMLTHADLLEKVRLGKDATLVGECQPSDGAGMIKVNSCRVPIRWPFRRPACLAR